MTDIDTNDGATREGASRRELVERVALMEAMIAEGRRTTGRYGWNFVMWGLLYFAATGWTLFLPHPGLAWPVLMTAGMAANITIKTRQRARGGEDARSRTIGAVWAMMGIGVMLFSISGAIAHHGDSVVYFSAIMFFVGLAHATSAAILRWAGQGMAAAVWWGGGIASLFVRSSAVGLGIFLTATFFGMIVFGLYAMLRERRIGPAGTASAWVPSRG